MLPTPELPVSGYRVRLSPSQPPWQHPCIEFVFLAKNTLIISPLSHIVKENIKHR